MMRIGLILGVISFWISTICLAQNAIVGSGFSSGWGSGSCPTGSGNFTYFSENISGTYSSTPLTPNGTGNQFWRFGIDWSGTTTAQRTITIGSDVTVMPGVKYTLNNSCTTSGAMRYNVPNSNFRYIFKTLNAGTNPTGTFVFFEIQGQDVRSITTVSRSPLNPIAGDSVIITATLNGPFNAGQAAYLLYTTNNYATSTVIKMNGSGNSYQAVIPRNANVYNQPVSYYVFTSGDIENIASTDADLFTINFNNNAGSNFSYTPNFYRITPTLPITNQTVNITVGVNGTDFSGLPSDQAVYAHLGAVLQGSASTTWDVVKGNWGIGDGIGQFTPNWDSSQWSFSFKPTSYFATDVADPNSGSSNPEFDEEIITFDSTAHSIFRLAMVLRSTNADIIVKNNGTDTGADIYIDTAPGFWLLLNEPKLTREVIVDLADGTNYLISGNTSENATISITLDGRGIFNQTESNAFSFNILQLDTLGFGLHDLVIQATNGSSTKTFARKLNVFNRNALATINPANPTAETEITITFNAINTTLQGASKVYLHSAAVTESPTSQSWGSTIGNWGLDDGVGAMTETAPGSNIWTITLTPSSYYFPNGGLSANDNIFRLAMVFRNAQGTVQQKGRDGKDIYIDINPGFYIILNSPFGNTPVIESGVTFSINATTSATADFNISINTNPTFNQIINNTSAIDIDHSISTPGTYTLTVSATNGGITKTKTKSIGVYSGIISENPPAGMKYGPNYHNDDPTKVTLLLHLPTQGPIEVVHVIGSFDDNDWKVSETYKMKRSTDGNIWWLTINGLVPKKEYIYQYLVNGSIIAGDPYADKISDPDDQSINRDRLKYPNLIAYPFGKTQFRATVLQTDQEKYVWKVNNFKRPELYKANMYELLIRDFTDEGTYEAVIGKLDYIKSLGFNTIHLMPTSEFEGNESWGYNPNYYFAPDKFYGPKDKLKALVDEAHARGIAIVGDLVLNHSFYSSPFARFYWNQGAVIEDNCDPFNNYTFDPQYCNRPRPRCDNPWFNPCHNFIDEGSAWWGADFNHNSTHTQALMDSIIDYWMTEYRFDGFRFDFTKGFSNSEIRCPDCWGSGYDQTRIDNLQRMKNAMQARHPGAYVIFEHLANADEDRVLANSGVHMWGGAGITKRYENIVLGYGDTNRDLTNGVFNAAPFYFGFSHLMSYMESHDEERLAYEIATYGRPFIRNELNAAARDWNDHSSDFSGDFTTFIQRLKLAASINLLLPGARMVWQFGELGYDYSINYNGRTGNKPIRWDYLDNPARKELHDFYTKLLNLRKKHEVFHHLDAYDLNGWVKWIRFKHNGVTAIVMSNFQAFNNADGLNGGQVESFDITINDIFEGCGGNWYELLLGEIHNINVPGNYLLNDGDIRLYANTDLENTSSGTSTIGEVTWTMDWDDNAITITTQGMAMNQGAVVYFDVNPQFPVSGGSNSNGSLNGRNYDGTIINPPFRADFVGYIKNDYRESRLSNSANGWLSETNRTSDWVYGESNCATRRTITIPWSHITGGARPESFNWIGYITYNTGDIGTYGAQPNFSGFEANYGPTGPHTRNGVRYFVVNDATNSQNAFAASSYAHDGTNITNFGDIDISDFTMAREGSITINGNRSWNIAENFFVGNNATLNASSANITVGGKQFQIDGTFNANTSTVVFNGNDTTTITGNVTFHNLIINNVEGVLLNGNITITGTLTLLNGKIYSSDAHLITLESGALINAEIGKGSFISGPLRKVGNTDFLFPVGSGNHFAPIEIVNVTGGSSTDHFTAQYFDYPFGDPEDRKIATEDKSAITNFERISGIEYWDLSRSNASTMQAKVKLHVLDFNRSDITDFTEISIAHFNTVENKWENVGDLTSGLTNFMVRGTIQSNIMDNFSPITLSGTQNQPLPVDLISFKGRVEKSTNILEWETAFEKDNSHFEIYQASQNTNFEKIGVVQGTNNPTGSKYNYAHWHKGEGLYYYKLKQVDFDGKFEFSKIIAVQVSAPQDPPYEWRIFPNPVTEGIFMIRRVGPPISTSVLNINILDLLGRPVYSQSWSPRDHEMDYTIRLQENLHSGLYVLQISDGQKSWHYNLLIK